MTYSVPARLGYVLEEHPGGPVVYLCPLPNGPVTALTGSGAVIWLRATEPADDIADLVAADFDMGRDAIDADVRTFLRYLVGAGFLEES